MAQHDKVGTRKVGTQTPSSSTALPHERDEKAGATDGVPSRQGRQAYGDVKKGRQDTSRATESHQAYQRQKGG